MWSRSHAHERFAIEIYWCLWEHPKGISLLCSLSTASSGYGQRVHLYESHPSSNDHNFDEDIARIEATDAVDGSSGGALIVSGRYTRIQDGPTKKTPQTRANCVKPENPETPAVVIRDAIYPSLEKSMLERVIVP
jgi:hypothetical protein